MLGAYEKALARKTADVFERAGQFGYSPYSFTDSWFRSRTAQRLYNFDLDSVAQSYVYQYNSYETETGIIHQRGVLHESYPAIMYWAGYTITYWILEENTTWECLNDTYDMEKALASYDTLHTLSTTACIRTIKEGFGRYEGARHELGLSILI